MIDDDVLSIPPIAEMRRGFASSLSCSCPRREAFQSERLGLAGRGAKPGNGVTRPGRSPNETRRTIWHQRIRVRVVARVELPRFRALVVEDEAAGPGRRGGR